MSRSDMPIVRGLRGAAIPVLALVVVACAGAPVPPAARGGPASPARPVVTPTTVVPVPASPGAGDLVAVRIGADPTNRRIQLVDAATGKVHVDLPDGVIDRDGGLVYVTHNAISETDVIAYELETGQVHAAATFPGRLTLPTIGVDDDPVGLSGDGRTIALDADPGPIAKVGPGSGMDGTVSRFAVMRSDLTGKPKLVELPGRWTFDALSPDGAILYLVEHLTTHGVDGYQVRAYDVPAGSLREAVVVDKTAGSLLMAGTPIAQTTTSRGEWVYTLYRNRDAGPFVHALNAADTWALCIFPTRRPTVADEQRTATGWDLLLSETAGSVYAANGALGMVTRFAIADPASPRTISFASAGSLDASARGATMSPDAKSLHVASGGSVVRLNAASLAAEGSVVASTDIAALAARPAGGLYATSRSGSLSVVDGSGSSATVPLAGAPARILWVESRR